MKKQPWWQSPVVLISVCALVACELYVLHYQSVLRAAARQQEVRLEASHKLMNLYREIEAQDLTARAEKIKEEVNNVNR